MISSRTLLLSLFALNLIVFLWLMGFLPLTGKSERQPDRFSKEIEADKLEIVRSGKDKQAANSESDPQQSPVGGMPGLPRRADS